MAADQPRVADLLVRCLEREGVTCVFGIPMTVLIWQDDAYGLIKWKMDLELGHDVATGFSNPDFVAYAESFGARGSRVSPAADLLPALTDALAADTVPVITCPVDYTENLRLTDALGELSGPF